ncbi:hypothetical protein AB0K60_35895 [Thermopolyspora sp. NPDC052614]|uniref:hypothetical protein n=1 Tax=Thermopolyspora sp. NPDC052614 TaxID=3155682 RepID=UPI0034380398
MSNSPDHLVGIMSRAARWLLPYFSAPILVALSAFLGVQRIQGQLEYFRMSSGLLDPSIPDNIERGVGVTARSVFIVALIGLGIFIVHAQVMKASPALRRRIGAVCVLAGVPALVLGLLGWFGVFFYSSRYPVVPMLTAMGGNLSVYGLHLRRHAGAGTTGATGGTGATATGRAIAATLILINSYLAIWIMGVFAHLTGFSLAADIDRNPAITLCAARPLGLPGGSVEGGVEGCEHRYPGLLLVACGDTRCVFARKGDDGGYSAFLVHVAEDVVITGPADAQVAAFPPS